MGSFPVVLPNQIRRSQVVRDLCLTKVVNPSFGFFSRFSAGPKRVQVYPFGWVPAGPLGFKKKPVSLPQQLCFCFYSDVCFTHPAASPANGGGGGCHLGLGRLRAVVQLEPGVRPRLGPKVGYVRGLRSGRRDGPLRLLRLWRHECVLVTFHVPCATAGEKISFLPLKLVPQGWLPSWPPLLHSPRWLEG